MAIVIENGTGVISAVAYDDNVAFKAYHNARGNSFSGGGGDIDKACILATQYIDNRFGRRFKGQRCFSSLNIARSTMTMSAIPLEDETVTFGSVVYRWRDTLAQVNDVQIASNVFDTLANLIAAVSLTGTEGTQYFAGQLINPDVLAGYHGDLRILIYLELPGYSGNGFETSSTQVAGVSFNFAVTTGGGDDMAGQPLHFPRKNLFDREGQTVDGIPTKLKQAMYEYALRALTDELNPDPEFNESGRVVKKEKVKVGPIEEETEYDDTRVAQLRVYPVADALLQEYLQPAGGVLR